MIVWSTWGRTEPVSALSGIGRGGGKMPVESRTQVIPRGHEQRCREPAEPLRWAVSVEGTTTERVSPVQPDGVLLEDLRAGFEPSPAASGSEDERIG
jgi:hypothetical protein